MKCVCAKEAKYVHYFITIYYRNDSNPNWCRYSQEKFIIICQKSLLILNLFTMTKVYHVDRSYSNCSTPHWKYGLGDRDTNCHGLKWSYCGVFCNRPMDVSRIDAVVEEWNTFRLWNSAHRQQHLRNKDKNKNWDLIYQSP